ncbi:MAG: hypothetical protein F6J93_06095 [Oscillatoria sp. SIO1A7]|nr:hypothetical protein [Oscillatoria sp. SIO1A7]
MSYSKFNAEAIKKELGLSFSENTDLFSSVSELEYSQFLREALAFNVGAFQFRIQPPDAYRRKPRLPGGWRGYTKQAPSGLPSYKSEMLPLMSPLLLKLVRKKLVRN